MAEDENLDLRIARAQQRISHYRAQIHEHGRRADVAPNVTPIFLTHDVRHEKLLMLPAPLPLEFNSLGRAFRIDKSSIPGAGLGVFADEDIPMPTEREIEAGKGHLFIYSGRRFLSEVDKWKFRHILEETAYGITLPKDDTIASQDLRQAEQEHDMNHLDWIDGEPPFGTAAALINDPSGSGKHANCVFTYLGRTEYVDILPPSDGARVPIKKGDELLCSYGAAYWRPETQEIL